MTLGDRVAVMRPAYLQQVAPPQELYTQPANIFVAGFIGSPAMNVAMAKLQREQGSVTAVFGSSTVKMADDVLRTRPGIERFIGHEIVLGIRPESMEDASLLQSVDPASVITARVELREDLGSEVDVHVGVDAPQVGMEDVLEAVGTETAEARALAAVTGRAEGEEHPVSIFVARLAAQSLARPGDVIQLYVNPGSLYFFDPETRQAIV